MLNDKLKQQYPKIRKSNTLIQYLDSHKNNKAKYITYKNLDITIKKIVYS